jgi:hypothetical protein
VKRRVLIILCIFSTFIVIYLYAGQPANRLKPDNPEIDLYRWDDPMLYDGSVIDQNITIEFVVDNVKQDTTGQYYLNAHSDWTEYFSVHISKSDYPKIASPSYTYAKEHLYQDYREDYFVNKTIKVSGALLMHEGKPYILVQSSSQLEIIE